jgi:flagellar assembly factor FliW
MSTDTSMAAPPQGRLQIYSRFGQFEVDARDCVAFPLGLPGFERARSFAVVAGQDFAPFQCLHAVDDPVSFLVIDPRVVLPDYRCVLSPTDLSRLGAREDTTLVWLSIVSFDEQGGVFANLRAPIVINPERMLGYQVMAHNSLFPLRHPLASE